MYVYVKDGKIRLKSEERLVFGIMNGIKEIITDHKMTDRLIYEGGEVRKYEDSKQYGEDINRYHLQKELEKTTKENKQLRSIAYNKISKDMELETKKETPGTYHKNLYLLKHMKGSQHSQGTENE